GGGDVATNSAEDILAFIDGAIDELVARGGLPDPQLNNLRALRQKYLEGDATSVKLIHGWLDN
ncbi:MAG: hypothetical protein K8F91_12335, partial [Candidatus Obscuribacterales bacterium]|nr:hypothetical protein [Candidatus Obscuribacterales bacterium]